MYKMGLWGFLFVMLSSSLYNIIMYCACRCSLCLSPAANQQQHCGTPALIPFSPHPFTSVCLPLLGARCGLLEKWEGGRQKGAGQGRRIAEAGGAAACMHGSVAVPPQGGWSSRSVGRSQGLAPQHPPTDGHRQEGRRLNMYTHAISISLCYVHAKPAVLVSLLIYVLPSSSSSLSLSLPLALCTVFRTSPFDSK